MGKTHYDLLIDDKALNSYKIKESTIGHHSLSILNIKVLLLALATGYTGNNGG